MEVKVYWSSKAEKQFQSIVEYLETTWGMKNKIVILNLYDNRQNPKKKRFLN
jgi:plasmid stabilization system protein ParE